MGKLEAAFNGAAAALDDDTVWIMDDPFPPENGRWLVSGESGYRARCFHPEFTRGYARRMVRRPLATPPQSPTLEPAQALTRLKFLLQKGSDLQRNKSLPERDFDTWLTVLKEGLADALGRGRRSRSTFSTESPAPPPTYTSPAVVQQGLPSRYAPQNRPRDKETRNLLNLLIFIRTVSSRPPRATGVSEWVPANRIFVPRKGRRRSERACLRSPRTRIRTQGRPTRHRRQDEYGSPKVGSTTIRNP